MNQIKISVQPARYSGNHPWAWLGILLLLVLTVLVVGCTSQPASVTEQAATPFPDEISVEQAYQLYNDGAFVLDVRTQDEWDDFHAPNTTLIPLDQLPDRLNEVPKDQAIVVVCRSGNRSADGRDILKDAGYSQVTSVDGGLTAWRTAGYPIEP